MEQNELKNILQYILEEVEAENIVTIDELIHVTSQMIEARILSYEHLKY